jgi:hypothetical protein
MLDTGAPVFILNTAEGITDPIVDSMVVLFENGARHQRYVYQVPEISWGGITVRHASAVGQDLTGVAQFLGITPQVPLLGIVGLPQLESFAAVFDYSASYLELYPLDSRGTRPPALGAAGLAVPLDTAGGKIFVTAVVDGTALPWQLDTGAPSCLNTQSVARLGAHVRETGESTTNSSFGGSIVSVPIIVVDTLHVGSLTYTNLRMIVSGAPTCIKALPGGRHSAGVLGDDFFSQRRVGLNLRARTLYMWAGPPKQTL